MADPIKDEQVKIDLKDFAVNESGQLHIANPEVAEKLKSSLADLQKVTSGTAAADNYVGCGGNAYQCGKSLTGMDELINVARQAKMNKLG